MNRTIISAILAISVSAGYGANAPKRQHHVPERLDSIRLIRPAAAEKNHILVANIGGAIPDGPWALSVTYAASRLQLNVWTNSFTAFDPVACFADPSRQERLFGSKAKVAVLVVDDPSAPAMRGVPGRWMAVNVSGLVADGPNAQTLRDRYAKTILKGMAYASGAGATLEANCSLYYGSSTLAGMDKTGIMITPMAYFPMLEMLRRIGGDEILSPAVDE